MNLCVFTGRLTRDPESRTTTTGKKVVNFGVAINEGKDNNGNELVTFVEFEAWNGQADFVENYFTKGKVINVQSRMRNDTWEDKTSGEKRSKAKFVVDKVNFVPGSPAQNEPSSVAGETEPVKAPKAKKPKNTPKPKTEEVAEFETESSDDDDEDIPF